MSHQKPELKYIPTEHMSPGKYQPRKDFDANLLQELAASIKSAGLIQPIVIRPIGNMQYEIIAGERRWRAAQLAGITELPCLVKPVSDQQAAAITTIENIQRKDLNPIEEAQGYHRLMLEFGYHHDEIAAIVSKSRTQISNSLRLLKLDQRVQTLLIEGKLSTGHGKILAGVASDFQFALATRAIEEGWSVRKMEVESKYPQQSNQVTKNTTDPNLRRLEQSASDQFGAEVKLENDGNKSGGWLKIRYYDNEILAGILEKLGVDYK